jgi:allantoinase
VPDASPDLVVHAPRAVLPDGQAAATVVVRDGRIEALLPHRSEVAGARVEDLGPDLVLLPGLVDTHVHINEPGRTHWEGFLTATRAAAGGGVTTLLDMPLNSLPPTLNVAALELKRTVAAGQVFVDVGFWGGAVPANIVDPAAVRSLHAAGVFGFKCFLADSGVPEFPPLSRGELLRAAELVAAVDGLLIVHAEDAEALAAAPPAGPDYAEFLASRPAAAEVSAIEAVLDASRRTGARVHVLHLSAAAALPVLAAARAEGVPVTVETCPHYLTLDAAAVPPGATEFKCCPPVRDAANADGLWRGLRDGVIDAVVSDHSPSPLDLKSGGFATAWGGVSSLQLGLPVVWTAARSRGIGLPEVVRWMATGPARISGLSGKGAIVAGAAADLVAFAPEEEFTVVAEDLAHRHPITPYAGKRLHGVVRQVWLGGAPIGEHPTGRLLRRGEAA